MATCFRENISVRCPTPKVQECPFRLNLPDFVCRYESISRTRYLLLRRENNLDFSPVANIGKTKIAWHRLRENLCIAMIEHLPRWSVPTIRHGDGEVQSSGIGTWGSPRLTKYTDIGRKINEGSLDGYQRIPSQAIGFMHLTRLDSCDRGVNGDDDEAGPSYNQLALTVGFLCILSGLVLSKHVIWNLELYYSRHPGIVVPLALILLSFALMTIGIWLAAYGFGAFSHF
jgi:hypothetical protein